MKVSFEEIKKQAMEAKYTPYLLHYKREDSREGNEISLQELKMAQRHLKANRIGALKVQEDNDRKIFSALDLSKSTTALQLGDSSQEDEVDIIHVQKDINTVAEVGILPSLRDKSTEFEKKQTPLMFQTPLKKKTMKAASSSGKSNRVRLVMCTACN